MFQTNNLYLLLKVNTNSITAGRYHPLRPPSSVSVTDSYSVDSEATTEMLRC
ncbi:hypothetical protein [Spirosoma terrae]